MYHELVMKGFMDLWIFYQCGHELVFGYVKIFTYQEIILCCFVFSIKLGLLELQAFVKWKHSNSIKKKEKSCYLIRKKTFGGKIRWFFLAV